MCFEYIVMVLFLGAFLFHNSVVNFMYGVLTLYIILNISFFVLLEFLKRSQNCKYQYWWTW